MEKLPSEQKTNLSEKFIPRIAFEVVGLTSALELEIIRGNLVKPKMFSGIMGETNIDRKAVLGQDSPLFNVLQNSGDFYDGYWISFATYNSLELIDYLQNKITKRYMPQRVKSGITMLAAVGAVVLNETGIFPPGGTPDLNDIPAGVIGALLFQGINFIGRKYSDHVAQSQKTDNESSSLT